MFGGGLLVVLIGYGTFIVVGAVVARFIGLAAEHHQTPSIQVYYAICAALGVVAVVMMVRDLGEAARGLDEALRGLEGMR